LHLVAINYKVVSYRKKNKDLIFPGARDGLAGQALTRTFLLLLALTNEETKIHTHVVAATRLPARADVVTP
jgi:hypothetical protein